jgi:hypothetical protein
MTALVSLIAIFLLVVFAGKHLRHPGLRSYFFIAMLTIVQVAIVLYFMYTIEIPSTN